MKKNSINDSWEKRSCPSCFQSSVGNPEVKSKIPAESLTFEEVREYFIGIRKEQVFFSYYRCPKCTLLYCPYYFNEAQLDSLYSDMPDNLLGAEKSVAFKTQFGYFKWFRRYVSSLCKYQELGPDIGLITGQIIREYQPNEVILIEPNISMHQNLAKLESPSSQVRLYRHLSDSRTNQIDLTIGIHVFDHLLDPLIQLRQINSQTNGGGFLGIVVHNEASLLRKILGNKWPPFCLQHPQLFNRATLEDMLIQAGFKKKKISKSINHFSLRHIGSMALEVLGLPILLKKFLPNFEIPLALGNQIGIFNKRASHAE